MDSALGRARSHVIRGNRWFEAIYSRFVLANPRLHAAVIRLLLPDEDVRIELFGSPLVINKRREAGYWRAWRAAQSSGVLCREGGSLLSLAMLLPSCDTFVDVGANVGLYSAAFARMRHLKHGLRIYAFEANPDTARRLQAGLAGCGVIVFGLALSDHDGMLTFVDGSTSLTFGVAEAGGALQLRGRSFAVPARRLDGMGILGDSIVIKIDVENHEREVLQGAEALFKAHRVRAVYLDGYADAEVPSFLQERGFSLFDGLTLEPGPAPTLLAVRTS